MCFCVGFKKKKLFTHTGAAESKEAVQRRKERYRQELLEQMAEQCRNKKKWVHCAVGGFITRLPASHSVIMKTLIFTQISCVHLLWLCGLTDQSMLSCLIRDASILF